MQKVISYLKANKITSILLLVVLYLLLKSSLNFPSFNPVSLNRATSGSAMMGDYYAGSAVQSKAASSISPEVYAPVAASDRLVATSTNLSLKVDNVPDSLDHIISIAEDAGGFMVNSSLSKPEDSASGNISIRVPSQKLKSVLDSIRKTGVKVVSENVYGSDLTDQYVDLAARLATFEKTKVKFEQILDDAKLVNDLLNVQRELINLQSQIDSLKGQQKYLEQTAKLSMVTVYLSTDELALPYTPDQAWRPNVVFKEAVRSLILTIRGLADKVIWFVVFAPLWLIPLLAIYLWRKRRP